MSRTLPHPDSRGLERILQHENALSDLLQELSDEVPEAWVPLLGFTPTTNSRETWLDPRTRADLVLTGPEGQRALIEVKLGHILAEGQASRYASLRGPDDILVLAALEADRSRIANETMVVPWTFVSLADLLAEFEEAARQGGEPALPALFLARRARAITAGWDSAVDACFKDGDAAPLCDVEIAFLQRLITRRMAMVISDRGYAGYGTVNNNGTESIIEAHCPIDEDPDRRLMAEFRIKPGRTRANLRFGVDFHVEETEATRRECFAAAKRLAPAMSRQALTERFKAHRPKYATRFVGRGTGLRRPKGDWESVLAHGYAGMTGASRRTDYPEFMGDRALRHQASMSVCIDGLGALEIVDFLIETLEFLRAQEVTLIDHR